VIDLVKARSAGLGRTIGIYVETKHPSYHASIGLPMEDALVKILAANGWDHAEAPVYIQSFETANLRRLRTITRVKLVQLLLAGGKPWDYTASGNAGSYASLATAQGLREIATYAHGVGPAKSYIIPRTANGSLGAPTSFVRDAHAARHASHGARRRRGRDPRVPTHRHRRLLYRSSRCRRRGAGKALR
jgi:glycerophosphoryl diester phosphodiesterase